MTQISCIIITKNEERNIHRCISSVLSIADEIIVVDSQSTDQTKEIAGSFGGVKILDKTWMGYSKTKNWGAQAAIHDLVLFLDADEALSEKLQRSILGEKSKLKSAYTFNRLNNYCGKWIYHGGFYPDIKHRFFNRNKGKWVGEYVHETVEYNPNTPVVHLEGDLLHYSYYTTDEHRERAQKYAKLGAQNLIGAGRKGFFFKQYFNPGLKFFKHFVLKAGFLDGKAGFQIAWISAWEVHLKYRYANELRKTPESQ